MKKIWTLALVLIAVLATLIIGCSKKKSIPLEPTDFGGPTSTATITQTNTPYAGTATGTYTSTRTSTKTATLTATVTGTPVVHPMGWIDDLEDTYAPNANDFTLAGPSLNKGGYWITYDDNSTQNNGTSYVWPEAATYAQRVSKTAGPFTTSSPGCPDSPIAAARISGYVDGCSGGAGSWWLDTTCSIGGITTYWPATEDHAFRFGFFGMGTQLTPTAGEGATSLDGSGNIIDVAGDCQEVDISAYTGVSFWVKGDGGKWRMKMPYTNQLNCDGKTGNVAQQKASSYQEANDIGHTWIPTAGVWEQKTIMFNSTDMSHESWAFTCSAPGGPTTCDLATLLQHAKQIQFQTNGDPDATTCYPVVRELWIDDIKLIQ